VTTQILSGADTTEETGRPPLALLGLTGLTLLLGTTIAFAVVLALTEPEELAFIAVPLAVTLVPTWLVWRLGRTWTHAVAVAATLVMAAFTWWTVFGLSHPASLLDFVPGVWVVLGVVSSLVGNIGAIVRRRSPRPLAATEARIIRLVAAIAVVAVVVSGTLALVTRSPIDPATAPDATSVEMAGFAFEPAVIEVDAGGQLLVHNRDAFVHDLAVPAVDLHVDVLPGSSGLVDVPEAPGSYVVYCTLHSDTSDPDPDPEHNMVARLVVR
jgi:plastocyanin